MLEEIRALVKGKDTCVLATVGGGEPHCSLMAYVTDDECREIYMVTHRKTSKYRNLTENPSVSLLMDTREEHSGAQRPKTRALTVAGAYEKVDNEERKALYQAKLVERHPHMKEFIQDPDAELFCIKVASFLLLDGLTDAHFERVSDRE
jgi:nitroimidazol reductase NimA-like FMN-containing flavoprotein (pyridoxamine 5'-phosphate oxidase superfamily)